MKAFKILFVLILAGVFFSCSKDLSPDEVTLVHLENAWKWTVPTGNEYSTLVISNFENNTTEFAIYTKRFADNGNLSMCYGEKGNLIIYENYMTFQPKLKAHLSGSDISKSQLKNIKWKSFDVKMDSGEDYEFNLSFILYKDELLLRRGEPLGTIVEEAYYHRYILTREIEDF